MAIRVSYTPYGAVGGLAEHAGRAQQAIREQQFAKQRESQAESIAAQERMQAERIGAGREEWQRKLTSQQEQFALNQELQQEQIFRQQQASEFATMRNAQVAEARSVAQQEQFEQNIALQEQRFKSDVAAREQSFELQKAQEERLMQSAQANAQAQELRSAFDFKKLETTSGTAMENLNRWKQMKQYVSPEEYTAGTIAISQGKAPRISPEATAYKQRMEELRVEEKEKKLYGGLTDRERTVAQEAFKDTFGTAAGSFSGLTGGLSKEELKNNYLGYRVRTGYSGKNTTEQKELDALFDTNIKTYEGVGYFDYYSEWNPSDPDIKQLRATATAQAATKVKGKINTQTATQYLQQARVTSPNASEQQIRNTARAMAERDGWEF